MRRIPKRALVLMGALTLVLAAGACSPSEKTAFESVNAFRSAHHVAPLQWSDGAHDKAVAWSGQMADAGELSHSRLSDGVPDGWRVLGENVAWATSVEKAMAMLEASPPHRANLLNPAFTSVAIGVVERDGKVWVTEVFIG